MEEIDSEKVQLEMTDLKQIYLNSDNQVTAIFEYSNLLLIMTELEAQGKVGFLRISSFAEYSK